MQIKRFEASDMTAALHQVKQTFGPNAVILSARSLPPATGRMGVRRKGGVEVTAAIDSQKTAAGAQRLSAAAAGPLLQRAVGDGHRIVSRSSRGNAMAQPRLTPGGPVDRAPQLRRILAEHEVRDDRIRDLLRRMPAPAAVADPAERLAQSLEAKGICAPPGLRTARASRVIALVGPTGVGKTTAAVRLAAQYGDALEGRIGLISCDDAKVAADGEIRQYARLLQVPVASGWSEAAMGEAMDRMRDRALVIVDTPGISPGQTHRLQVLQRMLAVAGAEIHLVLSAAARPGDQEKTLDRFAAMEIEGLVMTRLDETEAYGALCNLPMARRLPLSWLTFGPEIPEALRPATGRDLARLLLAPAETLTRWRGRKVWVVPSAGSVPPAVTASTDEPATGFVANRNSDIFHRPDCKWTRRIKAANMIRFDSAKAALARKFHPCRTCCPADEASDAGSRVSAPRNAVAR